AEGAAISAQIGHGGPVAAARTNRSPALSPSTRTNLTAFSRSHAATVADLDRVVAQHAEAARRAAATGFDAVEIHLGHNYLASAFLSPKLNKRNDAYGGSLAHRARLSRDIARAVRDAVGDRIAIIAKLNMEDGVPGGLGIAESTQVAQWLEQDGSVDALELTAGSSLLNPMYLFRGDAPLKDFADVMPQPIKLGVRLVGGRILRSYPYEDLYLLELAKQVRREVTLPLVLLGGITSRATVDRAMAEGFQLVAMGRALLREPDLVARMAADSTVRSTCTHCNRCMPTNYTGTRCVLDHPVSPRSAAWASGGSIAKADPR
ncbi:MAG: tRNA-dihydrouridine synthase, partial [Mycobacteriales bacterium]